MLLEGLSERGDLHVFRVSEIRPFKNALVELAEQLHAKRIFLPDLGDRAAVFPIASWINRKIGHRTLTHSLLGILLFGLVACLSSWGLGAWFHTSSGSYAWFLTLGFASHILVDTLNKTGVDLFWPARVRGVFFGNERYRIVSAGPGAITGS